MIYPLFTMTPCGICLNTLLTLCLSDGAVYYRDGAVINTDVTVYYCVGVVKIDLGIMTNSSITWNYALRWIEGKARN